MFIVQAAGMKIRILKANEASVNAKQNVPKKPEGNQKEPKNSPDPTPMHTCTPQVFQHSMQFLDALASLRYILRVTD